MTSLKIIHLDSSASDFKKQLKELLAWNEADNLEVTQQVIDIIKKVRIDGDRALLDYTNQFDQTNFKHPSEIELSLTTLKKFMGQLIYRKSQCPTNCRR